MATKISSILTALGLGAALSLPGGAYAQAGIFDPQDGVNAIFLGIGSAPDFMGSDDNEVVPAIVGRVYFGNSRRFVQLLGPQLSLNLLDNDEWQLGPQVVFRRGRDSDVDNDVVKRMREVDDEAEIGLFVGKTWRLSQNDPRHRFGVRADYASGEGEFGTLTANFWLPVSQRMVLNFGGGLAYGSSKWTNNYFGISGSDVALYPSLGGRSYNAGSGLYDFRLNVGVLYHVSRNWHVGAGLRYSQLQGDAADSPIVTEHGNKDQFIFGAAVGYAWQ
jgi:outer membrane protein